MCDRVRCRERRRGRCRPCPSSANTARCLSPGGRVGLGFAVSQAPCLHGAWDPAITCGATRVPTAGQPGRHLLREEAGRPRRILHGPTLHDASAGVKSADTARAKEASAEVPLAWDKQSAIQRVPDPRREWADRKGLFGKPPVEIPRGAATRSCSEPAEPPPGRGPRPPTPGPSREAAGFAEESRFPVAEAAPRPGKLIPRPKGGGSQSQSEHPH